MLFNTLRPRQNGCHFPDDIFKCIFLNENVWIPTKISMKFVPKGSINNIPALVQIMAWCRPGDKPLSEPMMVSLTTHICVTRSQWVNKKHADLSDSVWWNGAMDITNKCWAINDARDQKLSIYYETVQPFNQLPTVVIKSHEHTSH